MTLERINAEPPKVTFGSFVRGLWGMAALAWSLITTCEHRNRHWTGYYSQKCLDCNRVRLVYSDSRTPWHAEVA